jgi:formiminoglutamase
MTNPSITQSQKRFQESIGPLFSEINPTAKQKLIFLKSSSDIGVIRNGGRNGARFAPQSFLATFKKFASNETIKNFQFLEREVSDVDEEKVDFNKAQFKEAQRISLLLKEHPQARVCHLGGGHDHIYPLLVALSDTYSKVIVINIDAHADTRTDENHHSGTPFRRFSQDFAGNFKIYQIGLHPFANTSSTLSSLEKGDSHITWRDGLEELQLEKLFKEISQEIDEKTLVVFSLDADALLGSEVPGVSAVNPDGLTQRELSCIWEYYGKLPLNHAPILGIYELNPIYDTLASISMRTLASFVFRTLERE